MRLPCRAPTTGRDQTLPAATAENPAGIALSDGPVPADQVTDSGRAAHQLPIDELADSVGAQLPSDS